MVSHALEYLKSLKGGDADVIAAQANKYDWEYVISYTDALNTPIFAFQIAKFTTIRNHNLPVDDILKDLMLTEIISKTKVRGLWHGLLNQPIKTIVDTTPVEQAISEDKINALLNTLK